MKVTVVGSFEHIKIYFNGVLHLHFQRPQFIGLQSWVEIPGIKYCIQYTMKDSVILCEYDSIDKFKDILTEIDKVL